MEVVVLEETEVLLIKRATTGKRKMMPLGNKFHRG